MESKVHGAIVNVLESNEADVTSTKCDECCGSGYRLNNAEVGKTIKVYNHIEPEAFEILKTTLKHYGFRLRPMFAEYFYTWYEIIAESKKGAENNG